MSSETSKAQARYRPALRATVAASAAPYGYTLTVWTSGAVLSHARGIPSAAQALLFLAGAVAAYALIAGVAVGGSRQRLVPEPAHAAVWGGLHLFSVGLAIGAATLVAHYVTNAAPGRWAASWLLPAISSPRQASWPSPMRPAAAAHSARRAAKNTPAKPRGHRDNRRSRNRGCYRPGHRAWPDRPAPR